MNGYRFLVRTFFIGLCAVFVKSVVLTSWAGDSSENQREDSIPLDAQVQQEIARTVVALSAGDMPEDAVQRVVQEFVGFKNRTHQELLLQVLAVYGGKDEYRINPRSEMAKRLLLSKLLQDMAPLDIVVAVAPKYEQASDPKLQNSLRLALGMVIFKGGRVDPDFNAFSAYIAQNKKQPPQKLVGYMYGHDPQAAVLSMARIYGDKTTETELADRVKGDPKSALQSLSDRLEWWAHLYVVEMMKKNPQLRDPAILKKLEKDDNPLVKERVAEITSGK